MIHKLCKFMIFVGDMGGQMGLCLGASLLTLLELFEFVVLQIVNSFKKCFRMSSSKTKVIDLRGH